MNGGLRLDWIRDEGYPSRAGSLSVVTWLQAYMELLCHRPIPTFAGIASTRRVNLASSKDSCALGK